MADRRECESMPGTIAAIGAISKRKSVGTEKSAIVDCLHNRYAGLASNSDDPRGNQWIWVVQVYKVRLLGLHQRAKSLAVLARIDGPRSKRQSFTGGERIDLVTGPEVGHYFHACGKEVANLIVDSSVLARWLSGPVAVVDDEDLHFERNPGERRCGDSTWM
jgi:hypothetical protein